MYILARSEGEKTRRVWISSDSEIQNRKKVRKIKKGLLWTLLCGSFKRCLEESQRNKWAVSQKKYGWIKVIFYSKINEILTIIAFGLLHGKVYI